MMKVRTHNNWGTGDAKGKMPLFYFGEIWKSSADGRNMCWFSEPTGVL